jgi:signal transduction histidine kinase
VAEVCSLLAEEAARHRVRMDVDIERDLPLVKFDQVQIQQVLINLLRNGMDAMESVTGDRVIQMRIRCAGETVQTEVRDCGSGVKLAERIFEPFFTTKKHGMGMGLAICRSIVEAHSGRLWTEKNEPQGAAFIFTLPVEMKTVQ